MPNRRKATHVVAVDGAPMVYDLWQPEAPVDPTPVVLVHGWGGSSRYWASLVGLLGSRYTFIAPDLPGVARSRKVTRPRDLFDQVTALEALLDARGLDRVTVIGHSMGCSLAMLLHQRRPDRVTRLILTSLGAPKDENERVAFERFTYWLGFMLRFRTPALAFVPPAVKQAGARYFYRMPNDPDLLRAGFLDYLTMDYGTAYACARTAASPKILEAARAVRAPTLMIAGRNDRDFPPENVHAMVALIPGVQLAWIDECGHLPMVEHPRKYATLVEGFLAAGAVAPSGGASPLPGR